MENIFTLVEEFNKKLNRPIKDLDDIRMAMVALKEIREQQTPIDFQVGPIEVSDGHVIAVDVSLHVLGAVRSGPDQVKNSMRSVPHRVPPVGQF